MNKELYTTETAPARLAELGRTGKDGQPLQPVSVRAMALQHTIGNKLGRDWLFTEDDLVAMAALPGPGRPWVKCASLLADDAAPSVGDESEPPAVEPA